MYYSASVHVEKPKRAIPKMDYAAIFLLFAVPAMAINTYGCITDRLADPIAPIASNEEEKINKSKQGDDMPPGRVIPVSRPHALPSTKESFSMLSENLDWSQCRVRINNANCV